MTRRDAVFFVVARRVARQFEQLGAQVLEHRREVHWRARANARAERELLQQRAKTTDRELQTGARRQRHLAMRLLLGRRWRRLGGRCSDSKATKAAATKATAAAAAAKRRRCGHRRQVRVVLCDGLGALRDGVLGQLARKSETNSGLDFTRRDRFLLAHVLEMQRLSDDLVKRFLQDVLYNLCRWVPDSCADEEEEKKKQLRLGTRRRQSTHDERNSMNDDDERNLQQTCLCLGVLVSILCAIRETC